MNWPTRRLSAAAKDDPGVLFPAVYDDKSLPPTPHGLPPTPGLKATPPSIAMLAMPSPDESSSSSSNASHEIVDLTKYDVASQRRPNRLRKPPPSSYPFSFVPENPPPMSNFPYIFHRSTPNSPAQSFVAGAGPARAMSMHVPSPGRKLSKPRRRTSGSTPPATAAADISMARLPEIPPVPPLASRNSFGFLRRKKTSVHSDSPALPDLPPATPLTLNIPTFLPFHARKRDSWHVQPPSPLSAPSRPTAVRSPSADVFSQVAWNGVVAPTRPANRSGWKSTWSLSMSAEDMSPPSRRPARSLRLKKSQSMLVDTPQGETPEPIVIARPPLLRRHAVSAQPKRRWTLAMALTDEGISDELLVEKLEALRTRSRASHHAPWDDDDADAEWDRVWAAYDDELDADFAIVLQQEQQSVPPTPPPKDGFLTHAARTASMPALPAPPLPPTPSTATWQSARRALLTCRELVRTERHYLASLHSLLSGATRAPPPPLMRAYAAALAKESAKLLRRMEEDPSAWGVAAAFLGAEEGVEAALVGWCGVVGGWFADGGIPAPPRRLSKMRAGSSDGGDSDSGEKSERGSPVNRRATSWRRRGSSFLSFPSALSLSTSLESPSSAAATTRAKSKRERDMRPAVRDLAIVPTQRVMRYVLLYRDLLEHTPASSPSRALVARAVDTAVRIAQRCDRAQGNAAFLQRR